MTLRFSPLSVRATHVAIYLALNIIVVAVVMYNLYRASLGTSDIRCALSVGFILIFSSSLLSFFSWHILIRRVITPVNEMIDILYNETKIDRNGAEINAQPLDEVGKLIKVFGIYREKVVEAEQAMKDLRRQQSQFKSIISVMMEGMIIMSNEGKILMVNPVTEKIFGYSETELLGKNVCMLMAKRHAEKDQSIQRYCQAGHTIILDKLREVEALRKDGTVFPVELSVTEMGNGDTRTFVGTVRDISDRKKTEAEREHYLLELEKSNRDLDDFAYIVSHDMKEPLRGLNSFSYFLLEDYGEKIGEDGQKKLLTIVDLTKRLSSLLEALLYYSRVGRTELSVRETDLNAVVNDAINVFAIKIKEANATVNIVQDLPTIVCDHVRISEVFQNLICNALKYNDKTENRIEVGYVTDHPRAPGEMAFYVQDKGIGIPPEHFESIFKIFKRLHAREEYGGGTGSGLTIVKKIIERHGGKIWAESKGVGEGTTFFFTIPQADQASAFDKNQVH